MIKHILLFIIFITHSYSFTVYEDKTNKITPSQIIALEDKFEISSRKNILNSSYTKWLKYEFFNNTNQNINRYITFNTLFLKNVDTFYLKNNHLVEKKNGYIIPVEKREIKQGQLILKVEIEAQKKQIIFVRIKADYNINYNHTIYNSYEELINQLWIKNSITISQITILLISIFLILLLIIYNNDTVYKYYLFFLVASFIMQPFFTADLQKIIYIEKYHLAHRISIDIFGIAIYLFLINILNLKKYLPFLYKLSIFNIVIYLFVLLLEPYQIKVISSIRDSFVLPISLLSILIIVNYAWVKKMQFSTFIMLGWNLYSSSLIIALLGMKGIINLSFQSSIIQIGGILEIIVFSMMLFYRLKLLNDEKMKNEILLEKQSKFAIIGESLSNIEHQWRTPLSEISSNIMKLEAYIEVKGIPTKDSLQKSLTNIDKNLVYMTQLVDDFKNFYKQDKVKSHFHINFSLKTALNLLAFDFLKHNIKVTQSIKDDYTIYGYTNEFTQVILNILSNSKDIIIERKIANPEVNIKAYKRDNKVIIEIQDNAKGIDEKDIDNIFDQFYSSKKDVSTGIGLYMSKIIIQEKMDGKLYVENTKEGIKFIIEV